ncbi:MAG: GNAT family N-acetyltransferase [Lishizhenia sp.]
MNSYVFISERLGFRTWTNADLDQFSALNANELVMRYFPKTLTRNESLHFLDRLIGHQEKHNYCYFATEILETGEFIGFIGLAYQTYATDFTPATDIGWRLKPSAWNKGYATEGAKTVLNYAFNKLNLDHVIATCTIQNKNSENVMRKIGMTKMGEFMHPNLKRFSEFENCIYYQILSSEFEA